MARTTAGHMGEVPRGRHMIREAIVKTRNGRSVQTHVCLRISRPELALIHKHANRMTREQQELSIEDTANRQPQGKTQKTQNMHRDLRRYQWQNGRLVIDALGSGDCCIFAQTFGLG